MTPLVETLRELTAIAAPSGREGPMAEKIKALWRPYGPIAEDRIGNLSVTIGEGDSHVALVAHMDEVGFLVRKIRDDGFIGLNRLGRHSRARARRPTHPLARPGRPGDRPVCHLSPPFHP